MLIDTHAHLNFNAYKEDWEEVIKRTLESNIWIINIGTQLDTSKKAVKIAQKYSKGVYAAVGLHPIHLKTGLVKIKIDPEETEINSEGEDFDICKYRLLVKSSKKVVAIGEIGLDYYWKPKTKRKLELFKEKQKNLLLKQLELAKELNLPVIFHCRMAHDDLINSVINNSSGADLLIRGVVHCFTGDWEQAKKYLEMGFYLGFNGLIFKMNFDEIIRKTPLEKILIETDCPYLLPSEALTKEGERMSRNEPLYVKYVAEKIAKIKNMSFKEIAEITTKNAKRLFNLE